LSDYVNDLQMHRETLVETIIKIKYKLLFNYTTEDETISLFKKEKVAFDLNASLFDIHKKKFIEITHCLDKQDEISLTDAQIVEYIKEIESLINVSIETDSIQSLKDAVVVYVSHVVKLLNKSRGLKYAYNAIESSSDEQYHLIQLPYLISDLETVTENEFKVISMKTNLK